MTTLPALPALTHISPNFTSTTTGRVTVWFSYSTPIAFSAGGYQTVRVNDWSTTTGKHINSIDGGNTGAKRSRVEGAEFETRLAHASRLEELRTALRSASISYGELAELADLAEHIAVGDVELLEAAGVPEFDDVLAA